MRPLLETLNHAAFEKHVGSQFLAQLSDTQPVALELVQAEDQGITAHQERFTLLLQGPPDRFLPQATYAVEHPVLGRMDLFLVPIGREQNGFQYEAAFNRLVNVP